MNKLMILLGCLILWGCGSASDNGTPPAIVSQNIAPPAFSDSTAEPIELNVSDVALIVPRPSGWDYNLTDFGIVLNENISSVIVDGELRGILAHVFVPPLDGVNAPEFDTVSDANKARAILRTIIEDPTYVGSANVSLPVGFSWGGYDAAYYLVDNGDGSVSIVIGVVLPEMPRLVTCSISAPTDQGARIRDNLARLLDGLTVNGVVFDGDDLDELPNPLNFPEGEE
jgi:hypothetical protein